MPETVTVEPVSKGEAEFLGELAQQYIDADHLNYDDVPFVQQLAKELQRLVRRLTPKPPKEDKEEKPRGTRGFSQRG